MRQHETQAKILRDPQNSAIVTAHAQSSDYSRIMLYIFYRPYVPIILFLCPRNVRKPVAAVQFNSVLFVVWHISP